MASRIALQIAEGITFLHDNLVIFTSISISQAHVSENETVKLTDFHSADILSPPPPFPLSLFSCSVASLVVLDVFGALILQDDSFVELQDVSEANHFAVLLWEIASLKLKYDTEYADSTLAELPVDPTWPEPLQNLIKSCAQTATDSSLTLQEIVDILTKLCEVDPAQYPQADPTSSNQD